MRFDIFIYLQSETAGRIYLYRKSVRPYNIAGAQETFDWNSQIFSLSLSARRFYISTSDLAECDDDATGQIKRDLEPLLRIIHKHIYVEKFYY